MDRHGPAPVLVGSGALQMAGIAGLVAFVQLAGADWVAIPLAVPIGPVSPRLGRDEDRPGPPCRVAGSDRRLQLS
jgi:hypothetical protein